MIVLVVVLLFLSACRHEATGGPYNNTDKSTWWYEGHTALD